MVPRWIFSGRANRPLSDRRFLGGGGGATPAAPQFVLIGDQKTVSTSGGDSSTDSWVTRDINTVLSGDASLVSISSNKFTLQAGTYTLEGQGPAQRVANSVSRLWDTTNNALLANGVANYEYGGGTAQYSHSAARVTYELTIASAIAIELQHYTAVLRTAGLGSASTLTDEIYAQVAIWRH